mmetsp:Transcript_14604/g.21648  ORF Transcript_14604/g.21648 Transcript_14604/m.21648 type:complete len:90 (+) Transcript_14604:337-606(+)
MRHLSRKCVQHPAQTIWITLVLQSHLLSHVFNGMALSFFRDIFFIATCLPNMPRTVQLCHPLTYLPNKPKSKIGHCTQLQAKVFYDPMS